MKNNMMGNFIEWKDNLHKEVRGGQLMFDVPRYYR